VKRVFRRRVIRTFDNENASGPSERQTSHPRSSGPAHMISLPSRRTLSLGASALVLALILGGCGESSSGAPPAAGGKAGRGGGAAPVIVGTAVRKKVPLAIEAIGAIEASRSAGIRSQVTGVLQRIAIQEGQDVNAGDLLFEIDPRPLRNALESSQAALERLKVQLGTARSQVERYTTLQAGQMVSKEQFQRIQDEARALESQVRAAESEVANAKLQLEYSAIRAPFAGRTGNLNVHEGDLIRANEAGALVVVNQLSPILVTFGVPQQHLAAVNRARAAGRLPVRVTPPGMDEASEVGHLTFVDNMVDSTTGTIRLKAAVSNENQRLWPGQFATVSVLLAEPEVLTVPASAIQNSQNGQHVFVVSADRIAELRPVVVERTYEGAAVIAKGLVEGETIVVDGQVRVLPGRSVDIKQRGVAAPASGTETAGKPESGKTKKKEV
jgi:membrane fusion protein, multidrug efflux system